MARTPWSKCWCCGKIGGCDALLNAGWFACIFSVDFLIIIAHLSQKPVEQAKMSWKGISRWRREPHSYCRTKTEIRIGSRKYSAMKNVQVESNAPLPMVIRTNLQFLLGFMLLQANKDQICTGAVDQWAGRAPFKQVCISMPSMPVIYISSQGKL